MSYVILGRVIKNEYIALGTIFSTGAIAYAATRGGSDKKVDKVQGKTQAAAASIVDTVKSTFGSDDEESFVRDWIAKAEKEEAKH